MAANWSPPVFMPTNLNSQCWSGSVYVGVAILMILSNINGSCQSFLVAAIRSTRLPHDRPGHGIAPLMLISHSLWLPIRVFQRRSFLCRPLSAIQEDHAPNAANLCLGGWPRTSAWISQWNMIQAHLAHEEFALSRGSPAVQTRCCTTRRIAFSFSTSDRQLSSAVTERAAASVWFSLSPDDRSRSVSAQQIRAEDDARRALMRPPVRPPAILASGAGDRGRGRRSAPVLFGTCIIAQMAGPGGAAGSGTHCVSGVVYRRDARLQGEVVHRAGAVLLSGSP